MPVIPVVVVLIMIRNRIVYFFISCFQGDYMRNRRIILAAVGLILLALAVAPAQALFTDGFMDGEELINFVLFSPKPAYQKTAQDYIQDGNDWKERCEAYSQSYDERLRAYVRQEALAQNRPAADINAGMKEFRIRLPSSVPML